MKKFAIFTLLTCLFLPLIGQESNQVGKEVSPMPKNIKIKGEIQEIRSAISDKKEYSWSVSDTDIIVKVAPNRKIHLHLGPSLIIDKMINGFAVHQHIIAEVFRPEDMASGHYFVISLQNKNERLVLRNNELTPFWKKQSAYASKKERRLASMAD